MSEIDPFLDRVGQGADYLRGFMRTPLRRGMAVAGGFALLVGSLSACGGSPDAQPEGTQVGAGVAIESETPDNADISPEAGDATSAAATESPDPTPAPTESPLLEVEAAPSSTPPASLAPETPDIIGYEIDEGKMVLYADTIDYSSFAYSIFCSGTDVVRVVSVEDSRSEQSTGVGELQVVCDGGEARAQLVDGVEDIVGADLLVSFTDESQGAQVLDEANFIPGDDTKIPHLKYYEINGYNFNTQTSYCTAYELRAGSLPDGAPVWFSSEAATVGPPDSLDCVHNKSFPLW